MGGSHCFLKRMDMSAVTCGDGPDDASSDENAILILNCDSSKGCRDSIVIVSGDDDEGGSSDD